MGKKIATIRVAIGNVSWYDPINNIRISITGERPEANVYDDMDLIPIAKGLAYGLIELKDGSIDEYLPDDPDMPSGGGVTMKEVKEYVDQAVAGIKPPTVDLKEYAKITDLNNKISIGDLVPATVAELQAMYKKL